jgi:predicted nucleic acid-binding protein
MQSNSLEKIYLDSNVWFSYLLLNAEDKINNRDIGKTPIESTQAHLVINNIISDGNTIALISHLVIIEIISIIRKKVASKMKIHGNKDADDRDFRFHC